MTRSIDRIAASQEEIARSVNRLATGQEQMTREITKLQEIETIPPLQELRVSTVATGPCTGTKACAADNAGTNCAHFR